VIRSTPATGRRGGRREPRQGAKGANAANAAIRFRRMGPSRLSPVGQVRRRERNRGGRRPPPRPAPGWSPPSSIERVPGEKSRGFSWHGLERYRPGAPNARERVGEERTCRGDQATRSTGVGSGAESSTSTCRRCRGRCGCRT
jgi:hypothetical protein